MDDARTIADLAAQVNRLLSTAEVRQRFLAQCLGYIALRKSPPGPADPDRPPSIFNDVRPVPLPFDSNDPFDHGPPKPPLELCERYAILGALHAAHFQQERLTDPGLDVGMAWEVIIAEARELDERHVPNLQPCLAHVESDVRTAIADKCQAKLPDSRPSDDFRSVHWFGTDYAFTPTQAACMKVLWRNWKAGTPEVGEATIVEDTIIDDAKTTRLSHLFRTGKVAHAAWGTMIVPGSTKGSFRLKAPTD